MLIQDCIDLTLELAVSLSLPMMGSHPACTPRWHTQGRHEDRAGQHSDLPCYILRMQPRSMSWHGKRMAWKEGKGCHVRDPIFILGTRTDTYITFAHISGRAGSSMM